MCTFSRRVRCAAATALPSQRQVSCWLRSLQSRPSPPVASPPRRPSPPPLPAAASQLQDAYAAERHALADARAEGVAYVVGRSALRAAPGSHWLKARIAGAEQPPRRVRPHLFHAMRTVHSSSPVPVPLQRFLVEGLYGSLAAVSRPSTAAFRLPREGLLQLGFEVSV